MIEEKAKQNIFIFDRKRIEIDNVIGVCTFDEDYVSLESEFGRISIEGAGLMIDNLNKESKKISISGRINGVYYNDAKPKKRLFG